MSAADKLSTDENIKNLPWGEIFTYADQYNLKRNWVAAVIMIESGGDTWALRYEPNWKYQKDTASYARKARISLETERVCQACSWGLMQVMGEVARELGFEGDLTELNNPAIGIAFGTKKLAQQMKRYGKIEDAVSAYNAGSVRKTHDGYYTNQDYVNKFKAMVARLDSLGYDKGRK